MDDEGVTGRKGTAGSTLAHVARVRFFAAAREAAGCSSAVVPGATVADVLAAAVAQYGDTFAAVLRTSKVWVNGEESDVARNVGDDDEVAVLPPVSGGCS